MEEFNSIKPKKINLNEYEEQKRIDTEWEKVDHSILLCGWGEEEISGNKLIDITYQEIDKKIG